MWLLVRAYYLYFKVHKKTAQWFINMFSYSRLISEGFWLSVLSNRFILALDNYHYSRTKKYLQASSNLAGLYDWEEAMIVSYFSQCKYLLVLAAGGGREVVSLLKKGFQVDAYECNHSLVKAGRVLLQKEGLSALYEYVVPNHAPVSEKKYDGIILGWGAYIHVRGKEVRVNMLKEIGALMPSGGMFLLSYWHADKAMDVYCSRVFGVSRFFSKIFRTRLIEKGERLTLCSGRYFTFEEIAEELNAAGFEIVYQEAYPYGHAVARKA